MSRVTLSIHTSAGATRYRITTQDGRVLYRGQMAAEIAGQPADGYELVVPLDSTEHAVDLADVEALRGRIVRARRALES